MGILEIISIIGILILTVVYFVIIYKILHSMFDYVFFGGGFSKHLWSIALGSGVISVLTLYLWKIVAVIVGVVGIILALSKKQMEKRISIIIITVILIGIIVLFGNAFMSAYGPMQ